MSKPTGGGKPQLSGIYCGYRRSNRDERHLAKADLRNGLEPDPKHYTPKHWND